MEMLTKDKVLLIILIWEIFLVNLVKINVVKEVPFLSMMVIWVEDKRIFLKCFLEDKCLMDLVKDNNVQITDLIKVKMDLTNILDMVNKL